MCIINFVFTLYTVCSLPKQSGLCKAYIPRYYYDTKTRKCTKFIYGGCGGNANNFSSKLGCYLKCGRKCIAIYTVVVNFHEHACKIDNYVSLFHAGRLFG